MTGQPAISVSLVALRPVTMNENARIISSMAAARMV